MAVTEITPTQMVYNTGVEISQGAGTAINASNTMEFAYPKQGKLIIIVDSDHADTSASFAASDFAAGRGLGAVTFAVGNTKEYMIVVNSTQCVRKVGEGSNSLRDVLKITWAANSAGFVRAFYLP